MSTLIILTKKWGRNFTGATLATQHLVEKWIDSYENIEVYTLEVGEYEKYPNLYIKSYKSEAALKNALDERKKCDKDNWLCGYSDDHLGYILGRVGIPYVHTYHGNWPDAKYINLDFFLKSFYFIPLYKKTIRNAKCVVNVSKYMENYTTKFNKHSKIIHNGIDYKTDCSQIKYDKAFLMVGNIDKRKYGYAVELGKELLNLKSNVQIHIYGNALDFKTEKELKSLPNVVLNGHCNDIPYKAYVGFINTSKIENLSISVCEAIHNNIPVFCFDVGGLSEVVKNEKTGYLFAKYEVKEMAKKIDQYNNNGESVKIVQDELKDFNWEYASQQYLKLLLSL